MTARKSPADAGLVLRRAPGIVGMRNPPFGAGVRLCSGVTSTVDKSALLAVGCQTWVDGR